MKTMAAAKFKAQCLAVMDEVQAKRETVVLTKNGKPVAKLVPLEMEDGEDPLDRYLYPGLKIVGDITAPIYTDEEWDGFIESSMKAFD